MSEKITRRDAIKVMGAAGLAAILSGCGVSARKASPSDVKLYNEVFVPQELDINDLPTGIPEGRSTLMRHFYDDPLSQDTLVQIANIHRNYDIAAKNMNALVGEIQYEGLRLFKGFNRNESRKSQKRKSEEFLEFIEAHQEGIKDARIALNLIRDQEYQMPLEHIADGTVVNDPVKMLQSKIDQAWDPEVKEAGKSFIDGYLNRQEKLQPHLKVMIAAHIPEAGFSELYKYQSLDDRIEGRLTGIPYTQSGRTIIQIPEIEAIYEKQMKKAKRHLEKHDPNYWADIMDTCRDDIAKAIWQKYAQKDGNFISSKQLLGGVYLVNEDILDTQLKYGGDDALVQGVLHTGLMIAPFGGAVDLVIDRIPHIARPDWLTDDKDLKDYNAVQTASVMQLLGAEGRRNYARDKGPVFLYAALGAASTAFWIHHFCCSGGDGGSRGLGRQDDHGTGGSNAGFGDVHGKGGYNFKY